MRWSGDLSDRSKTSSQGVCARYETHPTQRMHRYLSPRCLRAAAQSTSLFALYVIMHLSTIFKLKTICACTISYRVCAPWTIKVSLSRRHSGGCEEYTLSATLPCFALSSAAATAQRKVGKKRKEKWEKKESKVKNPLVTAVVRTKQNNG